MSRAAVASGLRAGSTLTRVLPDEALAARASDGDGRAFAAIFDRHHQGLYRYCLALVGNPQDAQDALQNTMIKVLRALPGEERRIELKPWLYRIAHNESIELVRRRRETRPLDPDLAASGSGLADAAATRERLRGLISDLEKLPERQRGALVMRELAGLGFAEIATAFGTSPAVVRQTVYEARLSLRQMDQGRQMSCERVTRALSNGDGRVARRRDLRSHLRTCVSCRGFGEAIEGREREFAALAPLPAAAAAGLLQGLLGGNGAASSGLVTAVGGGAAKSLGTTVALKGAATVAVAAAIGVGAANRDLVDLAPSPRNHSQTTEDGRPAAHGTPGARSSGSAGPAAMPTTASVAAAKGSLGSHARQGAGAVVLPQPGVPAGADGTEELTEPGETRTVPPATAGDAKSADAEQAPTPIPAGQGDSAAEAGSESQPRGKEHEKQLPSASEHGQETAAEHKAEDGGPGAEGHPAHPAHPVHPSSPGSEEEPAAPPVGAEPNGNGSGHGNGQAALPPGAAEESPPGRETGKKP